MRSELHRIWPLIPHSAGTDEQLWELTLRGLEQLPQALVRLIDDKTYPVNLDDWDYPQDVAAALKDCFDAHGSDKGSVNDYYKFYASVLNAGTEAVFELGLGTTNIEVPSNIGAQGTAGASLRGFRDFLPYAQIFGADIDEEVLFQEERIQTRWVDQLNHESLEELTKWLPPLDLFIDDGLHSLTANLNTLEVALRVTKPGGWVVIEDITESTIELWQVVAKLLPAHKCHIFRGGGNSGGRLFAVQVFGNRGFVPPHVTRSFLLGLRGEIQTIQGILAQSGQY